MLSIDNSYIVITNAEHFNHGDLEVLKHMIIIPDGDDDESTTQASFEVGDVFYAEGEFTQVGLIFGALSGEQILTEPQAQYSTDVWTGNLSFPFPNTGDMVTGKWVSVDPESKEKLAQQLLEEIKVKNEAAARSQ